ncbi:hypothetical protein [Ulvibacter litoralis]|uniref:Uncharacterized protein n=1 Tax=Ulvibacter litoralis TaxID=227084 RepID=A0A1G7FKS9_9FLAO|nr:hypothetical protein [Ulvibacter litoralis]GHC50718.1 hypothetical protein GCM10008083_12870 [Ulvibacter litoralis]SDE76551.1 hypothetical protein SAMN05421855_102622 [Ulvibacter litoralis]
MEKQMHLAAQYLAAAGISFLDKKPDDSHTNLGFNAENGSLYTHTLSDNEDQLGLDYEKFALVWKSKQGTKTFKLDGATHAEVLTWLQDTSKTALNKVYHYQFHYDLPYDIDNAFTFKLEDLGKLKVLKNLRVLAQSVLETINTQYNLNASIRVWPHHFDSGIYSPLPDAEITIGLGLAIPDSICKEHYLYISGYKNGNTIDPSQFPKLKAGEWKAADFKGAVLNAATITKSEGVAFFNEAIALLENS